MVIKSFYVNLQLSFILWLSIEYIMVFRIQYSVYSFYCLYGEKAHLRVLM